MPLLTLHMLFMVYTHTHTETERHSPDAMPLLASTMMVVRPTLKMILWPKLSMASV